MKVKINRLEKIIILLIIVSLLILTTTQSLPSQNESDTSVSIQTDKAQYEIGETVNVVVNVPDITNLRLYYEYQGFVQKYMGNYSEFSFLPRGIGTHYLVLRDIEYNEMTRHSFEVIGKPETLSRFINLLDSKGAVERAALKAFDSNNNEIDLGEFDKEPGRKRLERLEVASDMKVFKKLVLKNLSVDSLGDLRVGIDEVPVEKAAFSDKQTVAAFAVDASPLDFTNGTLTRTAAGSELWKCVEWDFAAQQCLGEWLKIMDLTPGQDYELEINPDDPGYAETELAIINIQSYPVVGNNWTVMFTTKGTADLIIKAVEQTNWSNSHDEADLRFLEVKCGNATMDYEWVNDSVKIANYSCNETSLETSKVLTLGKHILGFWFGNDSDYANNWATLNCTYRRNLTFYNVASTENLANFTVMIKLNSSRINYSLTSDTDIRFYDADDTTLLSHHWERWNATGDSFGWVKIPQIDNTATDSILMYYNCSGPAAQDENNTYDSNFEIVHHLAETSGTHYDSTRNNHDGTPYNGVLQNATGKIDGADDLNGMITPNDAITMSSPSPPPTNYTAEAWVYPRNLTGNTTDHSSYGFSIMATSSLYGIWLLGKGSAVRLHAFSSSSTTPNILTSATPLTTGSWFYIVATATYNSSCAVYVNGTKTGNGTSGAQAWSGTFTIGDLRLNRSIGWDGIIDEVRISKVIRSPSWINASYLTMSDSFITYGEQTTANTPPNVTLEMPLDRYNSSIPNITFNCSATDIQNLQNITLYHNISGWSANNTANISGNSSWANWTMNNIPDGQYIWNCQAYDDGGLSSWATINSSFVIDTQAPTVTIVSPSNTTYNESNDIPLNYTSEDARLSIHSCWYSLDEQPNATLTDCENTTLLGLSNGAHNLTVYANDTVGNQNSSTISFIINVSDFLITIIWPVNQTYPDAWVWGNVTTNRAASWCNYSLDGQPNQTMQNTSSTYWYANISGLSEQEHELIFYCKETGTENITQSSTAGFSIDVTLPTTLLNYPDPSYNLSEQQVIFNCSAWDNYNLTNISLYGTWSGGWHLNETNSSGTNNTSYTFTKNLPEGYYAWNCKACDLFRCAFAPANYTLTIDMQSPNITLLMPEDNSSDTDGELSFACNATDNYALINITLNIRNSTGSIYYSNSTNISGTESVTNWNLTGIPDGNYSWNCVVYDTSGRSTQAQNRSFVVDTIAPTVTVHSPSGELGDFTPLFNASFGENVNSAWYNINNGSNVTLCNGCQGAQEYLYLAEGSYTIYVYANDSLGNLNDTASSSFTIDMNENYYDSYDDNSSIAMYNYATWNAGNISYTGVNEEWWNSSYSYRKQLNITNNNASTILGGNYSVYFSLNTSELVSQGKLLYNCNDLRIAWWNGTANMELDRINTTACNSSSTQIWFRLKSNISGGSSDGSYYIYYGFPGAGQPPANQSNIWLFYDDFESYTPETSPPGYTVKSGTNTITVVNESGDNVLEFGTGTGFYTKDSWFNLTDVIFESRARSTVGDYVTMILRAQDVSTRNYYTWNLGTGLTAVRYYRYVGDAAYDVTTLSNSWALNQFYTLEIRSLGNQISFYRDGVFNASITWIDFSSGGFGVHSGATCTQQHSYFKIRKYLLPEPSVYVLNETIQTGGSGNGNFTSKAINTTENITQIMDITWTEHNTDTNNNITVEISVDNGETWHAATNGSGLSGFTHDNSLAYRVFFSTNSSKTITILDMNITWSEQPANNSPTIDSVYSIAPQDPLPEEVRVVHVNFTASDFDGVGDLNDSTARAIFSKNGVKREGNCTPHDINATSTNYNCSVPMQYYDSAGLWFINVTVIDNSQVSAYNATTDFTYQELLYIQVSPVVFGFGDFYPGQVNQSASSNPLLIDNMGNVNLTQINITAYNLVNGSFTLGAGNITVNVSNASGTALQNAVNVTVPYANVSVDAGGVDANESLYFYISAPFLPALNYSSSNNWVISAGK